MDRAASAGHTGIVMRIAVVLAALLVGCATASVLPTAATDSGAHPAHDAHHGEAQRLAGPGEEMVVTGRILANDDRTSFRLQPDTGQDAYVLATPEHGEPTLALDELADQRVRITGTVVEGDGARVLRPTSIVAEHDHARAPHNGVVGMVGDRHLELVVTSSGEIRIYVLDAFMTTLDARGATGDVVIQTRDGATRSAPLRVGAERGLLVVEGERRHPDDDGITATLTIDAEQVSMTLPFRPEPSDHGHDHHPH